ncbi:glycoside hydrolase family 140 protein [Algoriphagus antarcticus]|nr:glycoside hydrolase family 140 protein [Algoriphagus antarcticus]
MKRILSTLLLLFLFSQILLAQQITGPIQIHENQRYFTNAEGEPFFWMADTAWELFHRLDLEESKIYLDKRASQGFNVVQAVALSELDGLNDPNANGDTPFLDDQYSKPNEAYWKHVDAVLNLAKARNIHIALLPTWGDKLNKSSWGTGPEIFNSKSAYDFGKWIGKRYSNQQNIIWVLGGDRNPRKDTNDIEVWNRMAKGIQETQIPANKQLMTFHPQPTEPGGSSNWFHQESWMDFNMHQTGHCPNQPTYQKIAHDLALTPKKPTVDGEPMYEEHPKCFDAKNQGYSEATDIRKIMYWNVFAGAAGQTYGDHAVWQMYDLDKAPINAPLKPWNLSLDLEVANQVKHLKNLILEFPFFTRIPAQELIASAQVDDEYYVAATRDVDGSYALLYFPAGNQTNLNLSNLAGNSLLGAWYDPRTGVKIPVGKVSKTSKTTVIPPSQGRGNDWVLILESVD